MPLKEYLHEQKREKIKTRKENLKYLRIIILAFSGKRNEIKVFTSIKKLTFTNRKI